MTSIYTSVFDMFTIGIGPSSSHTVGPMRAAKMFVQDLHALGTLGAVEKIQVELCGSLAATGIGHGTPNAILLGLKGFDPDNVYPSEATNLYSKVNENGYIDISVLNEELNKNVRIEKADFIFSPRKHYSVHSNYMIFSALDEKGGLIKKSGFISIGGGFIERDDGENNAQDSKGSELGDSHLDYENSAELISKCKENNLELHELAFLQEQKTHTKDEIRKYIFSIFEAMNSSIEQGLATEGILPGGLKVHRRAKEVFSASLANGSILGEASDKLTYFSLAVSEQNAAGGRVVTAPTNGSAGVLPAVFVYWLDIVMQNRGVEQGSIYSLSETGEIVKNENFSYSDIEEDFVKFLLTASAIGSVIKAHSSFSGADLGCQAEIGSACSMAAASLCALLGGTIYQVENAAEMALEHNLGLTCDPVGGLVQIPCIERNAVAANTAVSVAKLAYYGTGSHIISLDVTIETMKETGLDLSEKYKETAEGGLALNYRIC